jgi:transcription antitermination factor NusG
VLHGSQRRPIGEAAMELLERLAGREVAIVDHPAALVFDPDGLKIDPEPPDAVHVRSGPFAGRRGTWAGLAGLRRFAAATHLEAGFVRFGDEPPVALPLADLERFA